MLFYPRLKTLEDSYSLSPWAEPAVTTLRLYMQQDVCHDEAHILRVLNNALYFSEGGDVDVIIPAAILHDLRNVDKRDPLRNMASTLSSIQADANLQEKIGFKDDDHRRKIRNAIQAHSWSANIACDCIEAEAVQDADRIDALGYIGLARLLSVGGAMGRTICHPTDPLGESRDYDENRFTIDHFYVKLQHLPSTMKTARGKIAAEEKVKIMVTFLENLQDEMIG